jgi:TonB family protein
MTLKSSFGLLKALTFSILTIFYSKSTLAQSSDTLYIVDKKAEFIGGQRALSMYWQRHFKVPFKATLKKIDGEGVVAFKIDTEGRVQNAFIKRPLTPEMDAAALKAVREMPRWTPAEKDSEKIEMGQEMTYFLYPTGATNGIMYADLEEAEKVVRQHGFNLGLWTGGMALSNDFGKYMNPNRFLVGITFGYAIKRWHFGVEYDISIPSKVRNSFQLDDQIAITADKTSAFNVYFPVVYQFDWNKKWSVLPYLAPTVNMLYLEREMSKNERTTIATATAFGVSVGICADFLSGKNATLVKGKHRVNTAFVRTRLNVNPMNFTSKMGSTPLNGTAVSLTVGFIANFKTER